MSHTILAGPILRRTTKSRVCVWIATSQPMRLQLTVTDTDSHPLGTGGMEAMNPQGVQLGDHLFVHLLRARAAPNPDTTDGYPSDTVLYYRIDAIGDDGTSTPLFSDAELQQLAYGTHPYPSFFLPSTLQNLLHGSCRKPHGKCTSADALSHGHTLMEENWDDLSRRPAILLLTGDQIYADDVAIALNARLREQAAQLIGRTERMPQIGDPAAIPLHGRKRALKEAQSGFSSGESENHLLSFGEYAAMYLYAFGNVSAWEPVWGWDDLQNLGIAPGEEEEALKAAEEQSGYLRTFHSTLPDVRRLLANIPTYMMFDDHDVTDDWNITLSWYDAVRESQLGRRIVSNALAACWAFQSWGNDPDNFDKDMVWSIQQRLTDRDDNPDIAERYDLHTWKHRGWGFSVPTVPPILAIDSRTQRQYDDANAPAQLVDRYGLDWLRVEWAKVRTDNAIPANTWPVLIAATPVLGFTPVEAIQNWLPRVIKLLVKKYLSFLPGVEGTIDRALVNVMDIESWTANKAGYKALFDTLQARMQLPGCVFLSGDVHYAFSAQGEFVCDDATLNTLQLTSSALNNTPSDRNRAALEKLGDRIPKGKHHGGICWFGSCPPRKSWVSYSTLLRPEETRLPIHGEGNLGWVQFADGSPVRHVLLTGSGRRSYELGQSGD